MGVFDDDNYTVKYTGKHPSCASILPCEVVGKLAQAKTNCLANNQCSGFTWETGSPAYSKLSSCMLKCGTAEPGTYTTGSDYHVKGDIKIAVVSNDESTNLVAGKKLYLDLLSIKRESYAVTINSYTFDAWSQCLQVKAISENNADVLL